MKEKGATKGRCSNQNIHKPLCSCEKMNPDFELEIISEKQSEKARTFEGLRSRARRTLSLLTSYIKQDRTLLGNGDGGIIRKIKEQTNPLERAIDTYEIIRAVRASVDAYDDSGELDHVMFAQEQLARFVGAVGDYYAAQFEKQYDEIKENKPELDTPEKAAEIRNICRLKANAIIVSLTTKHKLHGLRDLAHESSVYCPEPVVFS